MRRAAAAVLAVGFAGVALSGCGLPDDREPQIISADEAPIDLDQDSPANNTSTGNVEVTLYFVEAGKLADVPRAVQSQSISDVVNALLARPTADEEARGLRTEIPAETTLVSADILTGIANIDLGCTAEGQAADALPTNCGIQGAEGTAQLTLFAQLVCTADALPGVDGVVFFQDGVPQPAPYDNGISTGSEPVDCADYRSIRNF